MARPSLILDAGAVIALSRGESRIRAYLQTAREQGGTIIVPPVVVTQTVRGAAADAMVNRVLGSTYVPFVGLRLAQVAGVLLGESGASDAADAQIMAEAARSAPSIVLTGDRGDLEHLLPPRRDILIIEV